MVRFVAVLIMPDLKGVKVGNTWGDWLNVNEETPIEYIDLCYHFASARMMAEMAVALGKSPETIVFTDRCLKLANNFATQFLRPDGSPTVETQSAAVLAISSGIFDEAKVLRAKPLTFPSVAQALVERIAKNDFRMATGFLGTKPLLGVLTANGQHDLACRLFQSRKFPSWGYEVEQGATSVCTKIPQKSNSPLTR